MSDVVRNADECARAIDAALEAMDPPIDVFEGILKLIAKFVPYGGEYSVRGGEIGSVSRK